jgi:hypothetical protein
MFLSSLSGRKIQSVIYFQELLNTSTNYTMDVCERRMSTARVREPTSCRLTTSVHVSQNGHVLFVLVTSIIIVHSTKLRDILKMKANSIPFAIKYSFHETN